MATYEVKWSRAALDDLERFLVYLLDEVSLQEALGICDRIFQSTLLLEKYPRLYQERSLSTGMVFAESSSWGDMCFTKSMMMIELAGSWSWLGRGRSLETCLNDLDGNEYGNESE